MKIVLLCAAAAALVVDGMKTCGCEARNFGFTIDCAATAVMEYQYNILQGCPTNATCSVSLIRARLTRWSGKQHADVTRRPLAPAPAPAPSLTISHFQPVQANATCSRAFLIVQSHHDYCDGTVSTGSAKVFDRLLSLTVAFLPPHRPLQVPRYIEDAVHEYEGGCPNCLVGRQFVPSLPSCGVEVSECKFANAPGSPANLAYAFLVNATNNCSTTCATTGCAAAFKTIRGFHDLCGEGDVSDALEDAVHDYEDVSEGLHAPRARVCARGTHARANPHFRTPSPPTHLSSSAVRGPELQRRDRTLQPHAVHGRGQRRGGHQLGGRGPGPRRRRGDHRGRRRCTRRVTRIETLFVCRVWGVGCGVCTCSGLGALD